MKLKLAQQPKEIRKDERNQVQVHRMDPEKTIIGWLEETKWKSGGRACKNVSAMKKEPETLFVEC